MLKIILKIVFLLLLGVIWNIGYQYMKITDKYHQVIRVDIADIISKCN